MLSKLVEDDIECKAPLWLWVLLLFTGLRSTLSGRCWYNPVEFVVEMFWPVIGLRLVLTNGTDTTRLACAPWAEVDVVTIWLGTELFGCVDGCSAITDGEDDVRTLDEVIWLTVGWVDVSVFA